MDRPCVRQLALDLAVKGGGESLALSYTPPDAINMENTTFKCFYGRGSPDSSCTLGGAIALLTLLTHGQNRTLTLIPHNRDAMPRDFRKNSEF
jgi:hypothetical protein